MTKIFSDCLQMIWGQHAIKWIIVHVLTKNNPQSPFLPFYKQEIANVGGLLGQIFAENYATTDPKAYSDLTLSVQAFSNLFVLSSQPFTQDQWNAQVEHCLSFCNAYDHLYLLAKQRGLIKGCQDKLKPALVVYGQELIKEDYSSIFQKAGAIVTVMDEIHKRANESYFSGKTEWSLFMRLVTDLLVANHFLQTYKVITNPMGGQWIKNLSASLRYRVMSQETQSPYWQALFFSLVYFASNQKAQQDYWRYVQMLPDKGAQAAFYNLGIAWSKFLQSHDLAAVHQMEANTVIALSQWEAAWTKKRMAQTSSGSSVTSSLLEGVVRGLL